MAKVTPKKLDPKDGKWVTINGNHIFIKTGQTVQQALNETVGRHKAEYESQESSKTSARHEKAKKKLDELLEKGQRFYEENKGNMKDERGFNKRSISYEEAWAAQRDYYSTMNPKTREEQVRKDVFLILEDGVRHKKFETQKAFYEASKSANKIIAQKGYGDREMIQANDELTIELGRLLGYLGKEHKR